jgi:uncharacterized delta-60 repeat protein
MRRVLVFFLPFVVATGCTGLIALDDHGSSPGTDAGADAISDIGTPDAAQDVAVVASDAGCSVLSLSQAQVNVTRGSSGTITATVGGPACDQATLQVTGLPDKVRATLPDGGAGGVLTLNAAGDAALGPARVLVSMAGSDAGADGVPFTLLVQDPSGTVDTTFGDAGVTLVRYMQNLAPSSVVVADDGSIFVAGNVTLPNSCVAGSGPNAIVLAKLDGKGGLDPSFGHEGVSIQSGVAPYTDNIPVSLLVTPDGGLFTAGFYSGPQYHSFVGAGFLSNGTPDPSFGAGGYYTRDFGTDAKAYVVLRQSDGKLVLGGFAGASGVLVRTTSRGKLDLSFGDAGTAWLPGGPFGVGGLSSDSIVVGETSPAGLPSLVRYNANGVLDSTYGDGGPVGEDLPLSGPTSLLVQPDDSVVIASGIRGDAGAAGAFGLWRYQSDGTPDPSFGIRGGKAPAAPPSGSVVMNALRRGPDGRFVVAVSLTDGGVTRIGAARFTPQGDLDKSFGGTGFVTVAAGLEAPSGFYAGAAFDSYGRVIVAGVVQDPANSSLCNGLVTRYWP